MKDVTLEVRSSNTATIHLYAKLGFTLQGTLQGTRKAYYNDNRENALIMTTPPIRHVDYQAFLMKLRNSLGVQPSSGTNIDT